MVFGQVLSGVAGLVGGALSMAAGEYISVFSQKDSQDADIAKERAAQEHVRPLSPLQIKGSGRICFYNAYCRRPSGQHVTKGGQSGMHPYPSMMK